MEVKRIHYKKKTPKVIRDEIIELGYHPEDEDGKQDIKSVPPGLQLSFNMQGVYF